MSAISESATGEILSIVRSQSIQAYCTVASSVLVFYDHAITFSSERELMWGRRWSCVTLLFHLNRWIILVWAVQQLPLDLLPLGALQSCVALTRFAESITLILFAIWAAFSGVRTYAISGKDRWLAAVVVLLEFVPVGVNIYSALPVGWYFQVVDIPIIGRACVSASTLPQSTQIKLTIATRTCVIFADVLVLLMTWTKTYATYRDARKHGIETPLAKMILRDGTLHFLALLFFNIFNIIGLATNVFVYVATFFSTPVSSVIITHFLLNLRHTASAQLGSDPASSSPQAGDIEDDSTWRSRLSFNHSFIDNLGEDLDYNSDALNRNPDLSWTGEDEGVDYVVVTTPLTSSGNEDDLEASVAPLTSSNVEYIK